MLSFKSIEDLNIKESERVLLRLDLNVPTNENGEIVNFFRINEGLPTILQLQKLGAKVLIIAHKEEGSLEKVGEFLQTKVENFEFVKNISSEKILGAKNGTVFMLENIRQDKREKSKVTEERDELGKELANLGDYYINEAFSGSHRDHASITSIPKFFTSEKKCLGPKFINEVEKLSIALIPTHPMLLLIGGAKFDTKLPMIEKFLNIADKIFVGGALAHSFWKNKNYELGKSLVDEEEKLSEKVLEEEKLGKIFLPRDVMVEDKSIKSPDNLGAEEKIVDFGPETLAEILKVAENSKTLVWNGPVDFYEAGYDWGTKELIEKLSQMKDKNIILGGGDTVTEIEKVRDERRKENAEFDFDFTHISTGGGAMIDFLSNGTLPGIEAIK
jgi:phosphoglycerate kinase